MGLVNYERCSCGVGCVYHDDLDVGYCRGKVKAFNMSAIKLAPVWVHVCEAHMELYKREQNGKSL